MKLPWYQPADDFFTDRLVHLYSSLIFIAIATYLALVVFHPSNLHCNTPEHFTDEQNAYIHSSCWGNGKFYVDNRQPISDPQNQTRDYDFNVIKTLPLVLMLQGLVFLAPRLLWNFVNAFYACDIRAIMGTADDLCTHRTADFSAVAGKVLMYLQSPCHVTPTFGAKYRGYNLVFLYLLCKLGYILSCVVQMSILTGYLGFDFYAFRYGVDAWDNYKYKQTYSHGEGLKHEEMIDPFPNTVLCDVFMRTVGKTDTYTLQCDLAANTAVETCLILLWTWLWFLFYLLLVSTLLSSLRILYYHVAPMQYRRSRVLSLLAGFQNINFKTINKAFRDQFVELVAQPDGLLILALLENNVSLGAASGLLRNMWMVTVADDLEKNMHDQYPLLSDEETESKVPPRLSAKPPKPSTK